MDIITNKIGKILAGEEVGHYIKILDDTANTGGYLIFTATACNFQDGFDNWVEDNNALARYFDESGWVIDWFFENLDRVAA